MTKRKFFIYTLINPVSNQVFYVGATQNPSHRNRCHRARNKSSVGVYCQEHGIKPIMKIVETKTGYGILSAVDIESKWIQKFVSEGVRLVNVKMNEHQIT